MIFILLYLRYSQKQSESGNMVPLILPVYYLVVIFEIVVGICIGLDSSLGFYHENEYVRSVKWVLYQSCSASVAAFLMHHGIGFRAYRNAAIFGLSWGLISGVVPIIFLVSVNHDAYMVSILGFLSVLFVFYSFCWLLPMSKLHRRPAMVPFARFYVIVVLLFILAYSLAIISYQSNHCIVEMSLAAVDFLQPFVVLRALRQDSKFWQGLYENASTSNLNAPLLGIWDMGRHTISIVADSICRLERKVVPIISFGALSIDVSKFYSGGSARVYQGQYKSNSVAVKILFCIELTPERVVDFCNEATLLNSLQHANVVKCYGVAVMPPAICLVTEFCHMGSLYDFLHGIENSVSDRSSRPHLESASFGSRVSALRKSRGQSALSLSRSDSLSHGGGVVDSKDEGTINPLILASASENALNTPVKLSASGSGSDDIEAQADRSSISDSTGPKLSSSNRHSSGALMLDSSVSS